MHSMDNILGKLALGAFLILLPNYLFCQENYRVIALGLHTGLGFNKARTLSADDPEWKNNIGSEFLIGSTLQYRWQNKWAFQAGVGISSKNYRFSASSDRSKFFIKYSTPYYMAAIQRIFYVSRASNAQMYAQLGFAYQKGNQSRDSTITSQETIYAAELSENIFYFLPEIGLHSNLKRGSAIDLGLVYNIGTLDILSADFYGETSDDSFATKGNYVGIMLRYFHSLRFTKARSRRGKRGSMDCPNLK